MDGVGVDEGSVLLLSVELHSHPMLPGVELELNCTKILRRCKTLFVGTRHANRCGRREIGAGIRRHRQSRMVKQT